ncbi:S-layer homology domain-containing protein [Bacillus litorisediminis]
MNRGNTAKNLTNRCYGCDDPDGMMRPNESVTRAQIAKVLDELDV